MYIFISVEGICSMRFLNIDLDTLYENAECDYLVLNEDCKVVMKVNDNGNAICDRVALEIETEQELSEDKYKYCKDDNSISMYETDVCNDDKNIVFIHKDEVDKFVIAYSSADIDKIEVPITLIGDVNKGHLIGIMSKLCDYCVVNNGYETWFSGVNGDRIRKTDKEVRIKIA